MKAARTIALAALAVIWLPLLGYSESTLIFPREILPQEFRTTGIAIVNPGSTHAMVTLALYGADGRGLGSTIETIDAGGQLAKLGSDLFPNAAAAGWIQATSATTGLQGFWLAGDLTTFTDGADAATPSTDLVLPLVTPLSEIHIVNTGTSEVTVLLSLLDTEGFDTSLAFPKTLPPKGVFKGDLPTLFPTLTDFSLPSHMHITCKCAGASLFAATVVARNFLTAPLPSWAVSNGIPAATPSTTIYFPYIAQGPQGSANWQSVVGITNLSTTLPNDIAITFTSTSGAIVRTNPQTLPPNGGVRFSARDLFGLTTGFQTGWVRVTSSSGLPVTGYVAYAELAAGGVAVVAAQDTADSALLFAHIADLPPWLTGLALLNHNTADANVEVFAMSQNGALIGSTSFPLPAGRNVARLLRDLIPQTQTREADGGFVFVRSNLPLYGIELFFSRNLQILANVSAGHLAPGISFEPPSR